MRSPIQKWIFLTRCIKCFGKKDEMNEIKNYYKKVLWFCAYLSSFEKSTFVWGSSYKSGVEKVMHCWFLIIVYSVIIRPFKKKLCTWRLFILYGGTHLGIETPT